MGDPFGFIETEAQQSLGLAHLYESSLQFIPVFCEPYPGAAAGGAAATHITVEKYVVPGICVYANEPGAWQYLVPMDAPITVAETFAQHSYAPEHFTEALHS